MQKSLLVSRNLKNGIFLAKLNRPHRLNALSEEMGEEIIKCCKEVNEDATSRVLIFVGDEKAFSSGRDLKLSATHSKEQANTYLNFAINSVQAVYDVKVPVISAISGHCLGWGLELALACDLRIISKVARLRFPETSLGLFPGAGGVVLLPRLVGPSVANDLIFTSREFSGLEASELGIASRLVESNEKILESAMKLGEEISKNAPLALRAAKQAMKECNQILKVEDSFKASRKLRDPLTHTKDHKEALKAFTEKRSPDFIGE